MGVATYDVSKGKHFHMHAAVLCFCKTREIPISGKMAKS